MKAFKWIFTYLSLLGGMGFCARKSEKLLLDNIDLHYYSQLRKGEISIKSEDVVPSLPGFDNRFPLKVLIHGWMGRRNHITTDPIKNAYLARGDVNLVLVDWSTGARQNYDLSRAFVPLAAIQIAKILEKFIVSQRTPRNNVHVLGHSLGAHIAGNIGKYFNGTLGRVTGLDPAGPLFLRNSSDALSMTDAQFVDSIHTDVGVLGELTPRAHVDFYPNRGFPPQPGCSLLDVVTASACSHYRAPLLYAESILLPRQLIAAKCDRDSLFKSIKYCKPKYNVKNPENVTYLGENVSRKARGIYYLDTNGSSPYGRGNYLIL